MLTEAEDRAWLERGWAWLNANPEHLRHAEFEVEWLARLRQYEDACRLTSGGHHRSLMEDELPHG